MKVHKRASDRCTRNKLRSPDRLRDPAPSYRTCANLRCYFVRCLTHRRPFLSGVGASGSPGAVHDSDRLLI